MKILVTANTSWNLVNFRSGLLQHLSKQGHTLILVAPHDKCSAGARALGDQFVELPMDNHGMNPFNDGLLLYRYAILLQRHRPDVVLTFTVKPNIYAGIAARFLGISAVLNITGLGAMANANRFELLIFRTLFRCALGAKTQVFFQNEDDQIYFENLRLLRNTTHDLLPGSGVNLSEYPFHPYRPFTKTRTNGSAQTIFVCIARLLKSKGIVEFAEAARLIGSDAWFILVGPLDPNNPDSISRSELDDWINDGRLSYLGESSNVRIEIGEADCVVLPSYREGTPKILLEAASLGRPIITTDTPGCRSVIEEGANGYRCSVRSVDSLVSKMRQFMLLDEAARRQMGLASRQLAERKFDEKIVFERYSAAISRVI